MISAFRALKPASNSTLKSRTPDQLLSTTTTSRPTIKPVAPDNISPAEQECLDYHNYFRLDKRRKETAPDSVNVYLYQRFLDHCHIKEKFVCCRKNIAYVLVFGKEVVACSFL